MASNALFSNKDIQNNVSRNGFDLGKRVLFTAKVGEILPIYHKRVMPGDKFRIDVSSFTRTQPVNTAAYTRIKEYYDFFYIPYRLLWRNAPASFTQMASTANTVALSPHQSLNANVNVPYLESGEFNNLIVNLCTGIEQNKQDLNNQFGFSRYSLVIKLLSYLGYINLYHHDLPHPKVYKDCTILPLLAYQKIYFDFFRNPQWEKNRPECYNVDYLNENTDIFTYIDGSVNAQSDFWKNSNFFDVRYCNYQKDLFMGALPNTQFGSESVVNINGLANNFTGTASLSAIDLNTRNRISTVNSSQPVALSRPDQSSSYPDSFTNSTGDNLFSLSGVQSTSNNLFANFSSDVPVNVKSLSGQIQTQMSILALRRATALQKYKEISQLGNTTYRAQIKKHFGVDVPESLGSMCTYLGGFQNAIAINEVVNQNLDNSESSALIRGKGTSIQIDNKPIDFDVKEHGLIMCVYHAIPLMDYVITGQSRDITAVDVSDYAIPEFDRLGLEPADIREFFNVNVLSVSPIYGYLPRYYSYKSDVDNILGAFTTTLAAWTAPYNQNIVENFYNNTNPNFYNAFKVNPSILDTIFPVNADSSVDTDPLLCDAQLNIKSVRNLDFNGLPY